MVVSKDTQFAIKEAIEEIRNEFACRIENVEKENKRLNAEVLELRKLLDNKTQQNKPLFSSLIKKTSETAPPISESETRVSETMQFQQNKKRKSKKE